VQRLALLSLLPPPFCLCLVSQHRRNLVVFLVLLVLNLEAQQPVLLLLLVLQPNRQILLQLVHFRRIGIGWGDVSDVLGRVLLA
jgi:hypothetical protein